LLHLEFDTSQVGIWKRLFPSLDVDYSSLCVHGWSNCVSLYWYS